MKQEAEDFVLWDDYLEWKAYQKSFEGLKKKIGEIEQKLLVAQRHVPQK